MNAIKGKHLFAVVLAMACVAGLAACSSNVTSGGSSAESGANTGLVAATVNGTEIMEDEVTNYILTYRSSQGLDEESAWGTYLASIGMTPETLREDVINYFIQAELVRTGAMEEGIEVSDEDIDEQVAKMRVNYADDEAWAAALEANGYTEESYRELVKNSMTESRLIEKIGETAEPISDEEMLSYVQMYADYFSGARRSSHILFSANDEQQAEEVLSQLQAGEIEFEDAAKEYSQDSSAENGGDVGWDILNSFITEYTDALGALDEGEISGVVESQYGYHIIKCTELYTAPEEGVTSLDQVPEALVDYIRTMMESSAESTAYSEWVEQKQEEADIVINPMPEGLPYDIDMSEYATESAGDDGLVVESSNEGEEGAEGTETEDADASSAEVEGEADVESAEAGADEEEFDESEAASSEAA